MHLQRPLPPILLKPLHQVPEGPDAQAALRLLRRINDLSCKGKCTVGSGGKSVG
jgi:hypothetical protein